MKIARTPVNQLLFLLATYNIQQSVRAMLILYLILFFMFIYWVWHRRHIYELSLQLPGPIGLPIFGSVFSVINPRSKYFLGFLHFFCSIN